MEEDKKSVVESRPVEQEIDLIELAQKVWMERKLILKVCGVAVLVGLVVAFSIPKEYSTSVTLAPETASRGTGGTMGALAAMAGINLGSSSTNDALSPELYPDIVSSTPFLVDLFDVRIKDSKEKIDTTLYSYLDEYQRSPWWGSVISAPFKLIGWTISLFKEKEVEDGNTLIDPSHLTLDADRIAKALSGRISVSVDKKTGVTTLSVTMQDPLISAQITDTVMHRLQNYITDYRTNKARHDLAFTEHLYAEAKAELGECTQEVLDKTVNVVRGRVGMVPLTTTNPEMDPKYAKYGISSLLVEIRRERRVELAMEGLRWFDICRWKIGEEVMPGQVYGALLGTVDPETGALNLTDERIKVEVRLFDPAKNYLWPIPQSVIDATPAIVQNPGY